MAKSAATTRQMIQDLKDYGRFCDCNNWDRNEFDDIVLIHDPETCRMLEIEVLQAIAQEERG